MRSLKLILLVFIAAFISCGKDLDQADRSIQGTWQVTEALTIYSVHTGQEFRRDENGDLGTLAFTESNVQYEFTRNDTLFSGDSPWTLSSERVNEGFIRVTKFTLEIEQLSRFEIIFEDATKNSEKNAEMMTLIEQTENDNQFIQLVLEK